MDSPLDRYYRAPRMRERERKRERLVVSEIVSRTEIEFAASRLSNARARARAMPSRF